MPTHKRVCLFAQFDPAGRLQPRILHYLGHLAECGFVTHIALSGQAHLSREDRDALARVEAHPHLRSNRGHDFGAWQHLLRLGCAEGAEEILLANDSVIGPFSDLRPTFKAMRDRKLDVWGMVASIEGVWHLQSWFICFSREAFSNPVIRRVFAQPFEAMSKAEIILHGELGLGTAVRAAGLAYTAVYEEPGRSRLRQIAHVNPMHLHWAWLIRRGGVPFAKIELFRDNPLTVPWIDRWPKVVAAALHSVPDALEPTLVRATTSVPRRLSWRTRLWYLLLTRDRWLAIHSLRHALFRRGD